ncbi:hypothetical protein ACOSQ4_029980 [Xanthoceras sorbifolium]
MENESRTPPIQNTGTGFLGVCFNATNAFLGIGLLTVPYALSFGGWLSLLLFLLITVIALYTSILPKRCMDTDPSIKSYLDIADRAFGAKAFLILEADNLHKLFPNFHDQTRNTAYCLMFLQPWCFSCLLILGSIGCVGTFFDGVGFHARGTLLNLDGIPTAVSLYIVCFAGHVVLPSIFTCGWNHKVTLNLPTGEFFAEITIYNNTTLLIPVTRYALMITPIANTIEGGLSEEYKNWRLVRLLVRIALLVSTLIVAYVFPYFENLMSIIGSILLFQLHLLSPACAIGVRATS